MWTAFHLVRWLCVPESGLIATSFKGQCLHIAVSHLSYTPWPFTELSVLLIVGFRSPVYPSSSLSLTKASGCFHHLPWVFGWQWAEKWTFFPFSGTANFLIVTFVKNREKVRCQGTVSFILLISSKMPSTHRPSDALLLLENGKFFVTLSYTNYCCLKERLMCAHSSVKCICGHQRQLCGVGSLFPP